jgi:hypothetical protein
MANWDRFDFAFNCPDSIKDKKLREGYQSSYAEVRAECEQFDMPVGFIMRAASMLDLFIKHQQTKSVGYGDDGGYANPAQEKDAINALQTIARDYDELLLKSRPKDGPRGVAPEAVRDALVMVLRRVEDQELRTRLQMQFLSEFEKIGL